MGSNGKYMNNRNKGLTLIELLAAIGICAVLAVLLFPALSRFQERSKSNQCLSNLKNISTAIGLYTMEYGMYPPGGSPWGTDPNDNLTKHMGPMVIGVTPPLDPVYTGTCLYPYFKDKDLRVFLCPSDPNAKGGWCGYGYNGAYLGGHVDRGAGTFTLSTPPTRIGAITKPTQTVMLVEGVADDIQPPSKQRGGYNWETYAYWNHKNGMNVAFVDGHVEWRSKDDEDLNAHDDRLWSGQGAINP